MLKDGNAVTIAATGIMVEEALKAHAGLKEMDIEAEIINVHTIKPLDSATILESVQKNGLHRYRRKPQRYRWFAQRGSGNNFGKFPGSPQKCGGVQDVFGEVGRLDELKEIFGLTAANIISRAKEAIAAKR